MKWFLFLLSCTALFANDEPLEVKLARYGHLIHKKETVAQEKDSLKQTILAEMSGDVVETPNCKAKKVERLSIRTSLEEARRFGATKMIEVIDRDKLRDLYAAGTSISGIEKKSDLSFKSKGRKKS